MLVCGTYFEVKQDLEAGQRKLGSEVMEKRLSDMTNMQGRCYGP